MTYLSRISALTASALMLCLGLAGHRQTTAAPHKRPEKKKEAGLNQVAAGPFDIKITPQTLSEQSTDPSLGRNSIEKQHHGDLEGTGKGEMLTVSASVQGSGVYVAVERVTGTLHCRKGSFSLYHCGVMTRSISGIENFCCPRLRHRSARRYRGYDVDQD